MRPALFAIALALTAVPAFAGGFTMDLPNLTWPTQDVTSSTKGCPQSPTEICR